MVTNNRGFLLMGIALLIILFFVSGCVSPEPAAPIEEIEEVAEPVEEEADLPSEEAAEEETVFTMDEIAQYDGKEGRSAYIVVDGVVYDVTNVSPWSSGTHYGFEAGGDVTDALQSAAPHGANMLSQAEIIGKIAK